MPTSTFASCQCQIYHGATNPSPARVTRVTLITSSSALWRQEKLGVDPRSPATDGPEMPSGRAGGAETPGLGAPQASDATEQTARRSSRLRDAGKPESGARPTSASGEGDSSRRAPAEEAAAAQVDQVTAYPKQIRAVGANDKGLTMCG